MKGVDPGKPSEIEFFYREESGKEFKIDEGCELVGVDKKSISLVISTSIP